MHVDTITSYRACIRPHMRVHLVLQEIKVLIEGGFSKDAWPMKILDMSFHVRHAARLPGGNE
jgi:hypothetical protein